MSYAAAPLERGNRAVPRRKTIPCAWLALGVVLASVDAEPQPEPPPRAPARREVEEIIVTAQKTEQSIQDVPISISTLGGEFLRETSVLTIEDATRYVPNAQIIDFGFEPIITVRGFSTDSFAAGAENSVGLVFDDVFMGKQGYFLEGLFDVDRVEVLRGPQGTLFGKNTTAGLFNIRSADPTDEWTARVSGRAGDEFQGEAGVGGPLTETFGVRLSALYDHLPSDETNTLYGSGNRRVEREAGRVKLRWRPTGAVELSGWGLASHRRAKVPAAQYSHLTENARAFLADYDPKIDDDPFDGRLSYNAPSDIPQDTRMAAGRMIWDAGSFGPLSDIAFTVIGGWTRYDSDLIVDLDSGPADLLSTLDPRDGIGPTTSRIKQLEARVGGGAPGPFAFGNLNFLAGFFYFDEFYGSDQVITGGDDLDDYLASPAGLEGQGLPFPRFGPGCPTCTIGGGALPPLAGRDDGFFLEPFFHDHSYAFFGQTIWRPIDPLALTVGLRFDYVDKLASVSVRPFSAAGPDTAGVVAGAVGYSETFTNREEISETAVSPRASLQVDLFEGDLTPFVTWARGFKSGAADFFVTSAEQQLFIEPEHVEDVELGFKGRFFDDTLQWNTALFNMDFSDLQVLVPVPGLLPFYAIDNAASALSRGVEMDATWLPGFAPFLTVLAGGAFLDARYTDYKEGPPQDGSDEVSQDLSGKPLYAAPKWSGFFAPALRAPLARLPLAPETLAWDVGLGFDVVWRSAHDLEIAHNPETKQDAYAIMDARLWLGRPDDRWRVALNVRNLADQRALQAQFADALFPSSFSGLANRGRQVTFDLAFLW